jgi:cytochrome b involved in lipid metabolism
MASSVPVPTASTADEKTYTLESLKEHSSRESLWMLLHDKVYDVTRFMDEVSGVECDAAHWTWISIGA